jgi:hypothetical protein
MDPFVPPTFHVCEKTHIGYDDDREFTWTCKKLRLNDSEKCWSCDLNQPVQFVNSPWTREGGFELFAHIASLHIAHLEKQINKLTTSSS